MRLLSKIGVMATGVNMTDKSICFEDILRTEDRLLEPICNFSHFQDYTLYQSEEFPHYYGGNGLHIRSNGGRLLSDWESLFHQHFDKDLSKHFTFTFERSEETESLLESAQSAGYHVEVDAYMACQSLQNVIEIPSEFEIKKIESKEDWDRFAVFYDDVSKDYDWYIPGAGTDNLFAKTRKTSEQVGIDWFCICAKTSPRFLGKLGIFRHNDIYRLQDVVVDKPYRRQKLATYLMSFALKRTLGSFGGRALALIADIDYHAIELYEKLGFNKYGESVCMMKYPEV